MLAILEWVAKQMTQIEAEAKVGAEKGKHRKKRNTHVAGARARLMDTRLGTLYLIYYIIDIRKINGKHFSRKPDPQYL